MSLAYPALALEEESLEVGEINDRNLSTCNADG